MRHITHTGVYAGLRVCGASEGEGAHYGAWVHNPDVPICPECLRIWEEETGPVVRDGVWPPPLPDDEELDLFKPIDWSV